MESEEAGIPTTATFHGLPLSDGWQSGEIKPSPRFGLAVGGATILAIATQTVLSRGELSGHQRVFQAAAAAVVGLFAIWMGGKGTSWDDKRVTTWLYGRKIKWRAWEDFSSSSVSRMSMASIFHQQHRNPENPLARFFLAVQIYKQRADPRNRTYEPPPSIFRSMVYGLQGISVAALATYVVATVVRALGLDSTESHMWAKSLVLAAFVAGIGSGAAFANREFRKWREPWRWKPVAEPTFDVRLSKLASAAHGLVPGKYYVYKPVAGIHQGLDFYVLLMPMAALVSGSKLLDGLVVPEALAAAAAVMTMACLALSALSEMLKMHPRKKPAVDDKVVVERTDAGLLLWQGGEATGHLHYPHPLMTGSIWSPSALEAWSDGQTSYTIDRTRLVEIPVYFPQAAFALTEGDGWMTPEAKAIADQMLAERDWSKPLPRGKSP